MRIGDVEVSVADGVVRWTSGMQIDADGAPRAYAPSGSALRGLDYLANAGAPGHWWGIVCDDHGEPYVQGIDDPAPGFYVSPTALCAPGFSRRDPRRYVDSYTVPYLAIPPELRVVAGVKLGDLAVVKHAGVCCGAIVADIGPRKKVGEGSMALARELGIPESPRNGGAGWGVEYCIFLGTATSPPWPRSNVAQLGVDLARARAFL